MRAMRLCWKTIPKMTGSEAAGGMKDMARTKAALMFRMETANVTDTTLLRSSFVSFAHNRPMVNPHTTMRAFAIPMDTY